MIQGMDRCSEGKAVTWISLLLFALFYIIVTKWCFFFSFYASWVLMQLLLVNTFSLLALPSPYSEALSLLGGPFLHLHSEEDKLDL